MSIHLGLVAFTLAQVYLGQGEHISDPEQIQRL